MNATLKRTQLRLLWGRLEDERRSAAGEEKRKEGWRCGRRCREGGSPPWICTGTRKGRRKRQDGVRQVPLGSVSQQTCPHEGG